VRKSLDGHNSSVMMFLARRQIRGSSGTGMELHTLERGKTCRFVVLDHELSFFPLFLFSRVLLHDSQFFECHTLSSTRYIAMASCGLLSLP
jgi:hypothetical protein